MIKCSLHVEEKMQKRIEIQTLNENLQEILNNIKQGSLSMGAIPYNGIVDRLDTKESTIIVHSLIPSLEPYHIIRIIKDEVECFIVKDNLVVPISEKSILTLMRNIYIKSKDEFQKERNVLIDLDIPEEIKESTKYLDTTSSNELDSIYNNFAQSVSHLREAKKEYIMYEANYDKITLQRKPKLNLTDSNKSARILVRERG